MLPAAAALAAAVVAAVGEWDKREDLGVFSGEKRSDSPQRRSQFDLHDRRLYGLPAPLLDL